MIKIKEFSKPYKLSGRTSLGIKFEKYDQELIDIVKGFFPAIWHKKEQFWEVPIYYLAKLLDTLVLYDDIAFQVDNSDETSEISFLTEDEINSFKYKPFDHQVDGINFLLTQKKSLLLDGCGVGKSLQLMYYAEALHKRGEIDHCLIICGVDSLRSNWRNEISKFSNESCIVLGERINKKGKVVYDSVAKRVEQLKNPIEEFFVIVNAATLRDDKIIEAIMKGPNKFGLIAVDEVHKFATKSSAQGSNLLKLKSDYKVAATGTVITNSPTSAYVALAWTENDSSTLTNFKSQYCNFGGFGGREIVGYKNLDCLQDELDSCSIRRTFDMIKDNMPSKTIEYELVEMSDEHSKFYEAIKNGVKEEADKIHLNSSNLLALTTRLRQATACPSVLTTQDVMSSKLERCAEVAEEILDTGEKVLIMCNFVESVVTLSKLLAKYNPLLGTGLQEQGEIENNVDKFRNSRNFNLFICTHSKMGTGFSFPECHYSLMTDTPWTDAGLEQSIDRVYRITSDQPVFIKIFACKDTFDERVKMIVDRKKDLADYLVDKVESESFNNELRQALLDL